MTTSFEIIKFLKKYYRNKPILGVQTTLNDLEELLHLKRFNKANDKLLKFAQDSFEIHQHSDVAKEICDYLLQEAPSHIETMILKATILLHNRNFSQAQPVLLELISLQPKNKQILELQIQLHKRLNHQSEYINSLKQYLEVYPNSTLQRIQLSNLLVSESPLDAFTILISDPDNNNSEILFQIAKLLYSIENYDMALLYLNEYHSKEAVFQKGKQLGTRIKFEKPESIFSFSIDQSEIRSYFEPINLSPDQYHFEFEDLNQNYFESFVNLKDGWDYLFVFNPQLQIQQTHFIEKSKFKIKYHILQEYKSIQNLLMITYPSIHPNKN